METQQLRGVMKSIEALWDQKENITQNFQILLKPVIHYEERDIL